MELPLIKEFFVGIIVWVAIVIWAKGKKRKMPVSQESRKYFLPGLYLKLFGGIGVGIIYAYYYGVGDTLGYFRNSLVLLEYLDSDPGKFFDILFSSAKTNAAEISGYKRTFEFQFHQDSSLTVIKIAAILNLITFESFFATILLYTTIFYSGVWALFRVLIVQYPALTKQMAIAVLFIPSVFFWGSGLLKDPIALSSLGWIVYYFYFLFIKLEWKIGRFLGFFVWFYLLITIKPYIAIALGPSLIIWAVFSFKDRIRNRVVRTVFAPLVILITVVMAANLTSKILEDLYAKAIDEAIATVIYSSQINLKISGDTGSGYDLGLSEPTVNGLIKAAPGLLNRALFRPYLWEASKIVHLLSSIESLVLFLFFLTVLFKSRIWGFVKALFNDPNLIFFVMFVAVFGVLVAVSSGTYGNLVRYKIPCIPFFVATLLVIRHAYARRTPKAGSTS